MPARHVASQPTGWQQGYSGVLDSVVESNNRDGGEDVVIH